MRTQLRPEVTEGYLCQAHTVPPMWPWRIPENTGKEKEGILNLGPELDCRPLKSVCLNKSQEEKFLEADKAASENKRF